MKTLLVLRHGKSSWSDASLSDHDRPLKGRGKRAAATMGRVARERDLLPTLILSSTATRARETARRFRTAAALEVELRELRGLYATSVDNVLRLLAEEASNDHHALMVVGHNPTFEDLVEDLSGRPVRLTTANLACLDFDVDAWSEVTTVTGDLRCVLRPRNFE